MKWLLDVLAEHAHQDLGHPLGRELVAGAILGAIPRHLVVEAIAGSAKAVLGCRGVLDADDALSREVGRNAAQSALLMLEVDADPDNELVIPEAFAP